MNSPITTANITAGATAIVVSGIESLGSDRSVSFYQSTIDQVIDGRFDFVVSDLLGIISISILAVNLFLAIRRNRNGK